MVVQCCECKQVRKDNQWVQPVSADLADDHVSHGYCPVCAEKAFAEIPGLLGAKGYSPRAATG